MLLSILVFIFISTVLLWMVLPKLNATLIKHKSKVLLVTAHPDDECMFFSPTLTALKRQKTEIHLLCMSIGNDQGLGRTREKELKASCKKLGVARCSIIDHEDLEDGMNSKWSENLILEEIMDYLSETNIDYIVSFDDYGVSGHPNHCAIYRALALGKSRQEIHQPIFKLASASILAKFTFLTGAVYSHLGLVGVKNNSTSFLATFADYKVGREAMHLHQSQMVWYRKLYLISSMYLLYNELELIK